jgi:putative FmdB family regulatory protein
MPIYEFKCLGCGNVFEFLKLKKESEEAAMKCPKCKSEEVERILSTVNAFVSSGGKKSTQTVKNCSSGSCTSFEIPGPKR